LKTVKPVISKVISELRSSVKEPVDEIEISFGIQFSSSGDIVIASLSNELNFQVKMKWNRAQ